MLVLTRKKNEKICIGKDITVRVVRVNKSRVSMAIVAPGEVRVRRGELPAFDEPRPPDRTLKTVVLTRKLDEKIHIGDFVVITVTDFRGDRVRLGIDAPQEVPVWRDEVAPAERLRSDGEETRASV